MNKQKVLDKLEEAWLEFNRSFAGLTEQWMTEAGVTGDWSVKDLLAHVHWWEEETLTHLPVILAGGRTPKYSHLYGGLDAFNALMTEKYRQVSFPELRDQLKITHQQLVVYLLSVGEEVYFTDERFMRRLRNDTYGHYPQHTKAILEWRKLNT